MNGRRMRNYVSAAALVMTVALIGLVYGQAKEMGKALPAAAAEMKCPMMDPAAMAECMKGCGKTCESNMADLSAATAAVAAAEKAVDGDKKAEAKAELAKAKELLGKVQGRVKGQIEKMPAANMTCPITGNPIAPTGLAENQCTMYKGQKIGFCCPACKPTWEKLSEADKDAKLKGAMGKMETMKPMMPMKPMEPMKPVEKK